MATKKSTSAEADVAPDAQTNAANTPPAGGDAGTVSEPVAVVSAPADIPPEIPPESEQGGAGDPAGTAQRSDRVLARVRSIGGPRRRAGISFTTTPVTLHLSDFAFDQDKAEAAFKEFLGDSRLSVLPPE